MHGAAPIAAPRANRWAFLVLSAATIVGVVAAVVMQIGPSKVATAEPTPAPVVVAQKEPAPRSDLATAMSPEPVAPPTVPTVAPVTELPTVTETAAPVATTSSEPVSAARVKSGPVRTNKPAPVKKKEPGTLRLSAYPWAWVQIDGGPRRDATGAKLALQPGRHSVRFFNDQGAVKSRTVTIESGRFKTLKVNFENDTIEEKD